MIGGLGKVSCHLHERRPVWASLRIADQVDIHQRIESLFNRVATWARLRTRHRWVNCGDAPDHLKGVARRKAARMRPHGHYQNV